MQLTLTNFENLVSTTILHRGRSYYKQQRAVLLSKSGNTLNFGVIGTRPYKVQLTIQNGVITQHSCSCPYDGILCKHEVACLYYIKAHLPEYCHQVEEGEVVEEVPQATESIGKTRLSLTQTYLLCYMAFSGIAISDHEVIKTPGDISLNSSAVKSTMQELIALKWLETKKLEYYIRTETYLVRSDKVFLVLTTLLQQHSNWLAFFKTNVMQNCVGHFLLEVSELLLGFKEKQTLDYTKRLFSQEQSNYLELALIPMARAENAAPVFAQLDFELVAPTLEKLLWVAYLNDSIEQMTHVGEIIHTCSSSKEIMRSLRACYRLYYFYFTGEELPSPTRTAVLANNCFFNAAKSLYAGEVDAAIKFYQSGLKEQNSYTDIKNIPGDPITTMLYTIALATRRADKDLKALQVMTHKTADLVRMHSQAVAPLIQFFMDSRQETNRERILEIIKSSSWKTDQTIGLICWHFMHCVGEISHYIREPQCALLKTELAAYISTVSAGNWPYPSLLQRFAIRPSWELRLEELIAAAGGKTTQQNLPAEMDQRLLYFCSGYSNEIQGINEQNRLKSGEWGKGKQLSWSRYQAGDCPMDALDKQIHDTWFSGLCKWQGQWPSLEFLLPYLKGTDKLSVSRHSYGLETYEIREEMPYILTEKDDNTISFFTNVPGSVMSSSGLWYDTQETTITYYPLAMNARKIFESIIDLGSVPLAAEPMLENLFEALRGKVEIQSDIRGAVQLEQVDGNPELIVRITPFRDEYEVNAMVRPLPDGQQLYRPGQDNEIIFDRRDGQRVMVKRPLQQEKNNLIQWQQLLSDQGIDIRHTDTLSAIEVLTILDLAPLYPDLFVIEWPEGEKIRLRTTNTSQWQITTQGKGGWFELEGEFALDENKVLTISQLLNLLRESKGRFIQLEGNDYIALSESLRRQLAQIDAVAQDTRGKVRVPEIGMAVMGDALNGEISIDFPKKVLTMRQRIAESARMDFAVPESLNATLRDYQIDGYQWLMRLAHWGAGACLADDMGLGKTVQTIAFLLAHASEGPQMVVAPASVVNNWQRELARFAPSLRVSILNDFAANDRESVFQQLRAEDILILTYGLLITEQSILTQQQWTTVCLDEAHTIKNRDTKSSAVAMQLNATYRIILTGTPIQNHLGELWNLFQFINPGLLGSYEHFSERFLNPIAAGEDMPRQQLRRLIAPFLLRRTKQEVARELPDKVDITVPVDLSESEMAVYEVIRREAKEELENATSLTMNALAMITKLRMAACSAALAEKKWKGESSKLSVFIDKVQAIVEGGNRVLIFSQFTSFLTMARQQLDEAGLKEYFYLDGQTPIRQRQKMVNDFQAGKQSVFLISLKAGGLGLNLTGANYVIHLDPWWNPAIEQQATDRAYRIGQQQKVTVYHLIAQHTIEEKIVRLHQTKRSLADSLLEGTNISNRLTPKELLQILEE